MFIGSSVFCFDLLIFMVFPSSEDIADARHVGCCPWDLAQSRAENVARDRVLFGFLRRDFQDHHSGYSEDEYASVNGNDGMNSLGKAVPVKREYRKCRIHGDRRLISELVPYSDVRPRSFHCVSSSCCASAVKGTGCFSKCKKRFVAKRERNRSPVSSLLPKPVVQRQCQPGVLKKNEKLLVYYQRRKAELGIEIDRSQRALMDYCVICDYLIEEPIWMRVSWPQCTYHFAHLRCAISVPMLACGLSHFHLTNSIDNLQRCQCPEHCQTCGVWHSEMAAWLMSILRDFDFGLWQAVFQGNSSHSCDCEDCRKCKHVFNLAICCRHSNRHGTVDTSMVDIEEPKRPKNVYFMWLNENREALIMQCGTASRDVFSKFAAQQWRAFLEDQKAAGAKKARARELEEVKAVVGEVGKSAWEKKLKMKIKLESLKRLEDQPTFKNSEQLWLDPTLMEDAKRAGVALKLKAMAGNPKIIARGFSPHELFDALILHGGRVAAAKKVLLGS